jgi:hypothetical protein
MVEESSSLLNSLPERPLTLNEADAVASNDLAKGGITPLTIREDGPQPLVVSLMVVNEIQGKSYLVGYSLEKDGWIIIESWDKEDWSIEEQDETMDEWLKAEYDEETLDHSFIQA